MSNGNSFNKPVTKNLPAGVPSLAASIIPSYQEGLKLITGPVGSGKTTSLAAVMGKMVGGALHPRYRVPDLNQDGILGDEETKEYADVSYRLDTLMKTQYEDEYESRIVWDVLQRPRTVGTLVALRFCEAYLSCGGKIDDLGQVGQVLLRVPVLPSMLTKQNVGIVTTACKALHDETLEGTEDAASLMELVFEESDRHDLESILIARGILDAATVKELLVAMNDVENPVQDGVL